MEPPMDIEDKGRLFGVMADKPRPIQAEFTPLEEAEWAYERGGMPAALLAFLSHPEADGAVKRGLDDSVDLPVWDRVRAILAELKTMTERDWPRRLSR
jgi:hypothetical protein